MIDPNIYSDGVEVLAPVVYLCDDIEIAHAIVDAECARTGNYLPDDDSADDLPSGGTVIDAAALFEIWD